LFSGDGILLDFRDHSQSSACRHDDNNPLKKFLGDLFGEKAADVKT
jgi:hypothetical protein